MHNFYNLQTKQRMRQKLMEKKTKKQEKNRKKNKKTQSLPNGSSSSGMEFS